MVKIILAEVIKKNKGYIIIKFNMSWNLG